MFQTVITKLQTFSIYGMFMYVVVVHSKLLVVRVEFNKFVELGIFLYNSRFLFSYLCSVNLCQLNGNSRSVNTYIFRSYFLFENLYP